MSSEATEAKSPESEREGEDARPSPAPRSFDVAKLARRIEWGLLGLVAIYVVAQVFLGLHLYHGAWSLFQTLGLSHPRYDRIRNLVPKGIGLGVAGGNILIALSVFAGIVR